MQKIIAKTKVKEFIISGSSSVMVFSGHMLKSLIHFELIFVIGKTSPVSQHCLLKRLSFPPLYVLGSFVKD